MTAQAFLEPNAKPFRMFLALCSHWPGLVTCLPVDLKWVNTSQKTRWTGRCCSVVRQLGNAGYVGRQELRYSHFIRKQLKALAMPGCESRRTPGCKRVMRGRLWEAWPDRTHWGRTLKASGKTLAQGGSQGAEQKSEVVRCALQKGSGARQARLHKTVARHKV